MRKKQAKATSRKKAKPSPKPAASSARLLSAEGWKRLMMKKHRN